MLRKLLVPCWLQFQREYGYPWLPSPLPSGPSSEAWANTQQHRYLQISLTQIRMMVEIMKTESTTSDKMWFSWLRFESASVEIRHKSKLQILLHHASPWSHVNLLGSLFSNVTWSNNHQPQRYIYREIYNWWSIQPIDAHNLNILVWE